jgi:hypothetical protein
VNDEMMKDQVTHGISFTLNGKRIDPRDVFVSEAERLANELERCWADPGLQLKAAAELRRQQAEIARLRGLNEVLVGALKEIHAIRPIGKDAGEYALTVEHLARAAFEKASIK